MYHRDVASSMRIGLGGESISVEPILLFSGAYLLGSVPFGILVSHLLRAPDPRKEGSGNIGATNVMRTSGLGGALLTLAGDFLKGWAPTYLAQCLGFGTYMVGAVGLSSFLGHLFPLYLGFRGGKGVATGAGVMAAVAPGLLVGCAILFLVLVGLTRYVSLGSIGAALGAPASALIFHEELATFLLSLAMGSFVVLRHRENIQRLLKGKEPKLFLPHSR
jgi:glycerol-3-phosphate acyltransferase PlsY